MAKILNIAPNRCAIHPFDLKHGTDTGGYLSPQEIRTGGIHDAANNGYSAVAPSVFQEACRRWRETLPSSASYIEAYSFVDVGAGKGRVLLLAAELPFRKVIGVEFSAELARIAKKNVVVWKRKAQPLSQIRLLHEDAADFRWPRTPLLVYLNNPFDCALVERMAGQLRDAAGSGAGLVDVLYVNPGCSEELTRTGLSKVKGAFELLWDEQIRMDEADQHADPYGATADRVAAFRYRKSF